MSRIGIGDEFCEATALLCGLSEALVPTSITRRKISGIESEVFGTKDTEEENSVISLVDNSFPMKRDLHLRISG
jgi:hypothetical protein